MAPLRFLSLSRALLLMLTGQASVPTEIDLLHRAIQASFGDATFVLGRSEQPCESPVPVFP
jgi:hypothetical protein